MKSRIRISPGLMAVLFCLVSGVVCPASGAGAAKAAEIKVAVAANFTQPMQQIADRFEAESGHRLLLSFGSTGKLYAQIRNGAPFHLLLAADARRPQLLVEGGQAVAGSRFTYARGRLVLWSPDPGRVDSAGRVLREGDIQRLAIASPKLAPYGAAAVQLLKALELYQGLAPRLVMGQNIGQTFQFVETGNVALGLVAVSQVMRQEQILSGSYWIPSQKLYRPIRQDAVLLNQGAANPAAQALIRFLKGPRAREIMAAFGYLE